MTGDKIYTVKSGRATLNVRDGGDGFPLVLLHGWPESGYCWEPVLPHLGGGFRAIRPDLRGLGDSERGGTVAAYQKQELARDVLALLDEMGLQRFGLVGHDWGGAVAQEIAMAAKDRVVKLAIMNIHLLNNAEGYRRADAVHAARQHRASWYQSFMQAPGLAEAMVPGNEEVWLRTFLRGTANWHFPEDALAEYVRCYRIPGTPESGANYYRAMGLDVERWKTLGGYRFKVPTLLLFGIHDPVVIPEFLDGHEACFEQVELQTVDASHFLQEEKPREVGEALRAFFEEVS